MLIYLLGSRYCDTDRLSDTAWSLFGQGPAGGALVQAVIPGAPAAQAGLQAGDLITAVDGQGVQSVDELIVAIREHKVGQKVQLTYYRNGQKSTVTVTLQDNKGN